MTVYKAEDLGTHQIYRFRSLDALARRLGGDEWSAVHDSTVSPPYRKIEILKSQPIDNAKNIVAVVMVPSAALEDARLAEDEKRYGV